MALQPKHGTAGDPAAGGLSASEPSVYALYLFPVVHWNDPPIHTHTHTTPSILVPRLFVTNVNEPQIGWPLVSFRPQLSRRVPGTAIVTPPARGDTKAALGVRLFWSLLRNQRDLRAAGIVCPGVMATRVCVCGPGVGEWTRS